MGFISKKITWTHNFQNFYLSDLSEQNKKTLPHTMTFWWNEEKKEWKGFFVNISIYPPHLPLTLKGHRTKLSTHFWYLPFSTVVIPIPKNSQQYYATKTLPLISQLFMDLDVILFRLFPLELIVSIIRGEISIPSTSFLSYLGDQWNP